MTVVDYQNGGDLQLVLGTMFSGKTTYILSEIAKMAEINYKILYINIDFDTRSTNAFSTHNPFFTMGDNERITQNVVMLKSHTLLDLNIDLYDVIVVDESHFFEDLIPFVENCLAKRKSLMVAGLIADFNGKKFGHILDLIPICTNIIRLKAYCSECAKHKLCRVASYSKRVIAAGTSNIDIGGCEKYTPVCREHYST
jgi:thymidine kinase